MLQEIHAINLRWQHLSAALQVRTCDQRDESDND